MQNILLRLFLGLIASAVCFITWNTACSFLGTNKTTVYIYAIPVVTVIVSVVVLEEKITLPLCTGCILTIAGLMISENGFRFFTRKDV